MEPSQKNQNLFSHVDAVGDEAPAENMKPAVYTALFSGEGTSGQIA